MDRFDVIIQPFGLKRKAQKGQTLYEIIQEAGITLTSPCGGQGKCGKCCIILQDGKTADRNPNDMEKGYFSADNLAKGIRLARQATVHGNVKLRIPDESLLTDIRLGTHGLETKVKPLSALKKYYLEIPCATLGNLSADLERVMDSLSGYNSRPKQIAPELLTDLPKTIRKADWKVTTTVWNNHDIVDVEAGKSSNDCYCVAVEVGTTKIASYMASLVTGEVTDIPPAISS